MAGISLALGQSVIWSGRPGVYLVTDVESPDRVGLIRRGHVVQKEILARPSELMRIDEDIAVELMRLEGRCRRSTLERYQ